MGNTMYPGRKRSWSSAKTTIDIDEGLNVAFLEVEPNNGVTYHSHDTNETFVVLDGRWHFFWGKDEGESVELGPRDTISFPGPAERRFVNVSDQKGTLLHDYRWQQAARNVEIRGHRTRARGR